MSDGERIVHSCTELAATGIKDSFDDVNDLIDRICSVRLI